MDFGICATRQHLPFVCPQQQESLYVAVAELKDIPRLGSKCLEKDKQTTHFTASEDSHGTSPRAQHSNQMRLQGRCKSVKPVVSMMQ